MVISSTKQSIFLSWFVASQNFCLSRFLWRRRWLVQLDRGSSLASIRASQNFCLSLFLWRVNLTEDLPWPSEPTKTFVFETAKGHSTHLAITRRWEKANIVAKTMRITFICLAHHLAFPLHLRISEIFAAPRLSSHARCQATTKTCYTFDLY